MLDAQAGPQLPAAWVPESVRTRPPAPRGRHSLSPTTAFSPEGAIFP